MNRNKIGSGHYLIVLIILFGMVSGCNNSTKRVQLEKPNKDTTEEKLNRPNFHFTPAKSWMNDPNGMFYLNGKYHLYFQYYPDDIVWGPMHWGHAISEDLVNWKEQPVAIYPDSLGYIFSGSAVVDVDNTSGLGENNIAPVIAIFTYHNIEGEREKKIDFQSQAIAYSLDEGQTWTKYKGNPVIPNPGIKDFRDPKVVWDEDNKQWIMALATYEKTLFYGSKNLLEWELLSDFGENLGAHGGVWECPDFFPMKVENTDEVKWVLLQSLNPGSVNGGSGTQYFIGDFNGKEFIIDSTFAQDLNEHEAVWLDYGRDNYAGVTWSNIPDSDGRKLFIGWMSNWDYAQVVPTSVWRSTMTLARELKLKKVNNRFRIFSSPVSELNQYKKEMIDSSNIKFKGEFSLINGEEVDVNRSVIDLRLSNLGRGDYKFILSNEEGDQLEFGLNNSDNYYYIDRSKAGKISFSEKFADKISKAPFDKQLNDLNVQIILDKTSIELFYNDGETVMTEIFFPNAPLKSLVFRSDLNSVITIDKLTVSELDFNN